MDIYYIGKILTTIIIYFVSSLLIVYIVSKPATISDLCKEIAGVPLVVILFVISKDIYEYTHQFYFFIITAFVIYFSVSFTEKNILTKSSRIKRTVIILSAIIAVILIGNYFN